MLPQRAEPSPKNCPWPQQPAQPRRPPHVAPRVLNPTVTTVGLATARMPRPLLLNGPVLPPSTFSLPAPKLWQQRYLSPHLDHGKDGRRSQARLRWQLLTAEDSRLCKGCGKRAGKLSRQNVGCTGSVLQLGPPFWGLNWGKGAWNTRLSFKAKEMLKLAGSRQQNSAVCEENAQEKRVFSLSKYVSSGTKTALKSMSFREKGVRKTPNTHSVTQHQCLCLATPGKRVVRLSKTEEKRQHNGKEKKQKELLLTYFFLQDRFYRLSESSPSWSPTGCTF